MYSLPCSSHETAPKPNATISVLEQDLILEHMHKKLDAATNSKLPYLPTSEATSICINSSPVGAAEQYQRVSQQRTWHPSSLMSMASRVLKFFRNDLLATSPNRHNKNMSRDREASST